MSLSTSLPDLYTLFHEVLAHPSLHVGCVHSSDDCLEGSIDCCDPTATLHGDIKVVGQRPSRHLENIVRGFLVQEDLTEGGDEGARGAPVQRHKQEVGQDAGNNQCVRCLCTAKGKNSSFLTFYYQNQKEVFGMYGQVR